MTENDTKNAMQENHNASASTNGVVNHPKALEAGVTNNEQDVVIVNWDGPDDPLNPKNWSFKRKWAATVVVSAYTFITPISSSMIAPATKQIGVEFGITNDTILALIISIFVLAFAFGPLFLGPLSEIYGRARVLQLSNLFFLVFNIACGFSRNTGQMLAFRLLSGLGGSAPLSIGGGVLGDCWPPENRGQAIAIFSLAPILGPVLGPVLGAWIAEKSDWRWVFWSISLFCGTVQIIGFILLRETYAPVILEQKAQQVRIDMGLKSTERDRVRTPYDSVDRRWQKILVKALVRPFMMFFYEPIIQSLGIYIAFVYGMFYLLLTTVPGLYQGKYGEPVGIAGLHYIAFGVGLTGASQINARLMDRIYKYYKTKNSDDGRPEYRLPSMFPGAVLLPIGILIFGWGAEFRVFWIVPDIGLALLGAGLILIFQVIQNYVIDAFTLHAASALAAVAFLRAVAGFAFPLFAPAMFNALGYGKGNTILAVLGIVLGIPAPFIFWFYGERIRGRSRYIGMRDTGK